MTAESTATTHTINFEAINGAALRALPFLLARWLPGGKRIGKEYVALNPTRADRHPGSFKVVMVGPRATGDRGGDPISFFAYLFRLRQMERATVNGLRGEK
jgi:hypothetical protein